MTAEQPIPSWRDLPSDHPRRIEVVYNLVRTGVLPIPGALETETIEEALKLALKSAHQKAV